ncbi:pyridoxal-phosphate-dependent aminotransferase family protein [Enteractinococcus coprophilus]|uniref:Alanine-glyoxylate transaminase/serine-glyoxylate transaminase/serine-pyruvate transaminase n=1 Tax=Enteractinococcus coprophilus TaxID=1027633 RepID=A0A543AJX2_9MICC|nr:alanine--glyoxylate aminotransferase family protein [Enteractinococcus coprophilus]TQL72885.1 alanine-glyoxylate transaminase/serine-glyoxylate transaminase/serine-pyruvate transaminase [Enteractinococcus coprophilus]
MTENSVFESPIVGRQLFGPGPCNPYPEAHLALSLPLLGHLDPAFIDVMDATSEMLRQVWGTQNQRTLPLSATGSAGMEAAFVNTVRPGDVVVVAVNGLFGERMVEVAGRHGAEVIPVEHEYGRPVDVERVVTAHPNPKIIAAVHAETSTGVVSDIQELGQNKGDALLLADCVTSIGGIEINLDAWGVDLAYAGSQKCLGVAPGLAPFTISDRAFERRVEKPANWYLDLNLLGGYATGSTGGQRTYHHTAPTGMVVSLKAGLERILAEGLESVYARHAAAGQTLQDGLEAMGLTLFAEEGARLAQLTTVNVPEGVDSSAVRNFLMSKYNLEIGAGTGAYASKIWRIGLMGHNATEANAHLLLAALKDALDHA